MTASRGMRRWAGAALGLLLAAAPSRTSAEGGPTLTKPWEDPTFDKPENAARREQYEYTDMFNRQAARPPRRLRILEQHPEAYRHPETLPPELLLGDLLFHSPLLLGRRAAYFGLSCASCHPGGAASTDIFVGPESDRPGNVDLLSDYFNPLADDGIFAPRNVPSLRGIRFTGPYERDGSKASLAEVITGVVSREFGQKLRPDWLMAVEAYLDQLDFLPNAQLDPLGRLTDRAGEPAHRGQTLFAAPRPQLDGLSCAGCHLPETSFTDHRSHRFHHGAGEGISTPEESFDTPTLLNSVETPPYFFDGSADTLAAAVKAIDARSHLGLSAAEQSDLTAYLEAVGAVDVAPSVPTLREKFEDSLAYLVLLDATPWTDDAELWTLCLSTVRHDLHGAVRVADARTRSLVQPAVTAFETFVASAPAAHPSAEGRAQLHRLRAQLLEAAARTGPGAKPGRAHAER